MEIHPYTLIQPSDAYFVGLANKLYAVLCVWMNFHLAVPEEKCVFILQPI
ncbi:MAG: DUF3843 family protein [Phocaeicola sp.]